ncbi:urease accessory protein UreD [Acidocella aquatica]|uniref:urease accessory protein UreD n=1 Tax=Acidocella aquatica TaxID=1922313 RepID=UPI0024E10F83|nr:urease accessory protein UreD [Acidocella aquatica]
MPARQDAIAAPQRARGRLDLGFTHDGTDTRLDRFYQEGCLKARLPRGPGVEAVALNISGGIAGGDALDIALALTPRAVVTFTTQAAERVYRVLEAPARIRTRLTAGAGARLHYLPQETILFDGFSLDRALDIDLCAGAEFLGVESLIFGRLAMGEILREGYLRDRISLSRDGALLWQDSTRLEGDIAAGLDRPGVAAGARAVASVFAVGPGMAERLGAVRAALTSAHASASWTGDVLLARILAPDAAALRHVVARALAVLRPGPLPRVWQG